MIRSRGLALFRPPAGGIWYTLYTAAGTERVRNLALTNHVGSIGAGQYVYFQILRSGTGYRVYQRLLVADTVDADERRWVLEPGDELQVQVDSGNVDVTFSGVVYELENV